MERPREEGRRRGFEAAAAAAATQSAPLSRVHLVFRFPFSDFRGRRRRRLRRRFCKVGGKKERGRRREGKGRKGGGREGGREHQQERLWKEVGEESRLWRLAGEGAKRSPPPSTYSLACCRLRLCLVCEREVEGRVPYYYFYGGEGRGRSRDYQPRTF